MRRTVQTLAVWMVSAFLALAEDPQPAFLRVAEITVEPPEKQQQIVSVKMTPGVTRSYTLLRFECVYHQEFDWTNLVGKVERRINEPVRFAYEREGVRLTDDLDAYVSFKMPIGVELLRTRFGATTFRPDKPVTVSKLRIEARDGETVVWVYELPVVPGPQPVTDAQRVSTAPPAAVTTPKPPKKRAKLGAVDLD